MNTRMEKGMSRDEAIADAYPDWIKTQKACRVKPLEESFVPVLLMLQSKKTTIMGLTHRQPSVADSTARQVNSLGFDFSTTAKSKDSFVFPAKTLPYIFKEYYL